MKKILATMLIGIIILATVFTACTSTPKTPEKLYVEHKERITDMPSEMRDAVKEKIAPLMETDDFFIQVSSVHGLIEDIKAVRLLDNRKETFKVKIISSLGYSDHRNVAYSMYIGEISSTIKGYPDLLKRVEGATANIEDDTINIVFAIA